MRGVRGELTGHQVAGDDAGAPAVDVDDVDHLHAVPELDVAEPDLAGELLVGADEELLAGLPPGVEGTAHLGATEAAVVEQAAVLAGERHALGDHLVDDVDRHLGEAVDVGLPGAEVAALDRVVEQAMDAVAVALVVLGGVDAALRRDRVGAPRRVVERERLDLVAEFAERRGGRRAGEARADDDDLELALVRRVHQLFVGDEVLPLVGERTVGDLGIERDGHSECPSTQQVMASGSNSMMPACTAIGIDTLPTTTTVAMTVARPRRHELNRGLLHPIDWNSDQVPWNRWMPSAMLARM